MPMDRFARSLPIPSAALALAANLLGATAGHGQSANVPAPASVQIVVDTGFGGSSAHPYRLLAVKVLLTNTGDPIGEGVLEVVGPHGERTRRPFTLPPGSQKLYRLFLTLDPERYARFATSGALVSPLRLRVWADGRRLYDQPLQWTMAQVALLVDLTGSDGGLSFLNSRQGVGYVPSARAVRWQRFRSVPIDRLETAPRHAGEWEAADLAVVTTKAWSRLDSEQRAALRRWVERGGRLVMVGADPVAWGDRDASQLLPVTDLRWVPPRAAPAFQEAIALPPPLRGKEGPGLSGKEIVRGPKVPAIAGRLKPGAFVLAGRAESAVAAIGASGIGRVLWLGIDPFAPVLRQARNYSVAWERLLAVITYDLQPPDGTSLAAIPFDRIHNVVTTLPALQPPPLGALIAFGLVYATIFGPLQVWVLRRLRRTVRAWLVMPALAIGLTIPMVALGQVWGSAHTVVNVLQLIDTTSGSRSATAQTYCGIFSPTRLQLRLIGAEPAAAFGGAWISSAQQMVDMTNGGLWPDYQDDGVARFDRVGLVQYSQRVFWMHRPIDVGGGVVLSVDRRGGFVANDSPFRIRRGYVFYSDTQGRRLRRRLPGLAPGERIALPPSGWEVVPSGATFFETPSAARDEQAAFRSQIEDLVAVEEIGLGGEGDAYLRAEIEGIEPDLRVDGVPVTNRAAILLVRANRGR